MRLHISPTAGQSRDLLAVIVQGKAADEIISEMPAFLVGRWQGVHGNQAILLFDCLKTVCFKVGMHGFQGRIACRVIDSKHKGLLGVAASPNLP